MSTAGNVTIEGGCFTTFKYVEGLSGEELERWLGFDTGRLDSGFLIVKLADDQLLAATDFELMASTRWAKGLVKPEGALSAGENIESILTARNQEVSGLKQKVASFFAHRGGNTPAKVLPSLKHADGMKYPDAEALGPGKRSGVPQFNLLTSRRFVIVRSVP